MLHAQIPSEIPITDDTQSALARSLSFVGVVTLFFLVAYYVNSGIFVAIIVGERVIRYSGGIGGYHPESMILNVLWTVSSAGVISLNYAAFRKAAACGSPLRSALQLILKIFGLHYTLFVSFLPQRLA